MRKRGLTKNAVIVFILIGSILLAVYLAVQVNKAIDTSGLTSQDKTEGTFLLIDPGHGGKDGGASGADGTVEKDINLKISLPLADMLKIMGYPIQMTRDSDCMLCESGLKTIREQKVSDMKNRLKLYNQSRLTISIHQNQFPQTQYFGTQIFYSLNNEESKLLAASIRQSVLGMLQPNNTRELKKATNDIYLLSNARTPAIIVECGFLSNTPELAKLKDVKYQQQMAYAITCGVLSYNP